MNKKIVSMVVYKSIKNLCEFKYKFFVIFLVFIFTLPSIIRIYNLKGLYFSENIRAELIEVLTFIKKNKGYGATELKLEKIIFYNDQEIIYTFKYKDTPVFNGSYSDSRLVVKLDKGHMYFQ